MKNKTGKKLFRMTIKRKILLERIVTSINIRYSAFEEDSFTRLMIENNSKLSEEERAEKLKKADEELKHYGLLHDVMETYTSRHWDFLLDNNMKEKRGWKNEYDVPLDVYNKAIDDIIALLTWYQENRITKKTGKSEREYKENVKMLTHIKQYRNEQEALSNEAG